MILSREMCAEMIILFFSLPGNSILNLVHLSGLRRMMFQKRGRPIRARFQHTSGLRLQQFDRG
jgi:hypothetical protein